MRSINGWTGCNYDARDLCSWDSGVAGGETMGSELDNGGSVGGCRSWISDGSLGVCLEGFAVDTYTVGET
jgi:hypothetical protein